MRKVTEGAKSAPRPTPVGAAKATTAKNAVKRPGPLALPEARSDFQGGGPRASSVTLAVPQAHLASARDPVSHTVTADDVARISSMTDGAARNLQITQAYYDLSQQTAQLLGKDNGSWATFAVWASRQVGVSIRGEDLPKFIVDGLNAVPGLAKEEAKVNGVLKKLGLPQLPAIPDLLLKADGAEQAMSQNLAEGNKEVFQEIGKEFAIFDQTFQGQTHYDQKFVDQYLAHFQPGQEKLRDAFASYAKAMFEQDPNKKAQEMLYANDLVGLHEQTRLQPMIEGALNAPRPVLKDLIQGAVNESLSHLPGPLRAAAKFELDHLGAVDKLTDAADAVFRHAATKMMMRLTTPTQVLHLGEDLPLQPGHKSPFPPGLTNITDPKLKALIGQLDRNPGSLKGTAAHDWTSLADRMGYIGDLFRSRQQDPTLFDAPFATRPTALVA